MGRLVKGFEDRRIEQLIDEDKYKDSCYEFDSIIISAINFIFDYSGIYNQINQKECPENIDFKTINLERRLLTVFNHAQVIAKKRYESRELILDGNFEFLFGQQVTHIIPFFYQIYNTSFIDTIRKDVASLDEDTLLTIAFYNYVELFYKHFNEIEESDLFVKKPIARRIAIKNQNNKILNIFKNETEYRKKGYNLTFISSGNDMSNWNVKYFK